MTPAGSIARISVVIPAYNAAWCIARALDSVLAQTLSPAEVLVVDDGSTDATADVLARYRDRIRMIHQPNQGLSSARNTGVRQAEGDWVAFLDADDYWLPQKLERQAELVRTTPGLVFCSTAARIETPDGLTTGVWECAPIQGDALKGIFARNAAIAGSGSAVMARRDLLLEVGLFDESLRSLEDIDMWLRLAARGRYACASDPLAVILKRRDSMSGNLKVMRGSALRVMKKNRHLLDRASRGRFWQAAYATVLADYAKWEYRSGHRVQAMIHLAEGLLRAPLTRGRLVLGLFFAMTSGQPL